MPAFDRPAPLRQSRHMGRSITTVVLSSLLGVGLAGCDRVIDSTNDLKAAVGIGCGDLDKIDRKRLPTSWMETPWISVDSSPDTLVRWGQEVHQRLQETGAAQSSSVAEAEIRLARRSGGYVPPQYTHSLVARRQGGAWTLYAVAEKWAPPPDAPLGTEWAGTPEPQRIVRLSSEDGRRLDRALTRKCIWQTPRFLPDIVPLREGGVSAGPNHGPFAVFDVRWGSQRWSGAQFNRLLGPPLEMGTVLFRAATGDPWDGAVESTLLRTGPSEEDPLGMEEERAIRKR